MIKKQLTVFILAFLCAGLFAATPEEVVPKEFIAELLQERYVSVIHEEDDSSLSLVPESIYKDKIISNRIEKKSSPYTAEFLYLVSKKEVLESGKKNLKQISMSDISVIFTALSNMSGMCYRFSDSNPDGTVLYKKVCTTDADGNEIPDRISRNCSGMNVYCYQHDRLLGNLNFYLDYKMQGDELYLSILNKSNLGLLGFNACKKENLRINIHVTDCGENILFYISADANYENVLKMFSIRKIIKKLMNERLDAIYHWFFIQF